MRVILAEKPSVAQSIAAVLGADQKRNGYLQGENDLVSWCIGHLIELAPPEIYDARYAKWRREDLPIVPSAWESVVSDGTKKQFAVLKRPAESNGCGRSGVRDGCGARGRADFQNGV